MMDNKIIANIYELPPVPNVCNQILREIIKLPKVSGAHVTMNQGDESLIHEHNNMKEIYYILSGEGILYCGNTAISVEKGAYISINPNTHHKLHNTGRKQLTHLVFAMPPFNPKDVILTSEKNWEKPSKI